MQFYIKAFAAIFTFTIGTLAAFFLMPLPDVPVVRDVRFDEAPVSVCELARRPELYDGKFVRIKAKIEFNNSGASSFVDNACLQEWVRISCDIGYDSCRSLLEDVRRSDADETRIIAVGRFFASVLERVPGGVNTRVPLFEITETKGLEIKGGSKVGGHNYNPCKYDGRRCGYGSGTGSGSGHGQGSGDGNGTGRGEGRGSGTGSGYSTNTSSGMGSGDGSGRGGGGSGGR